MRSIILRADPCGCGGEKIARLVADALRYGERQLMFYELGAWAVMANHVHVLLKPKVELRRITKVIKSFTANRANALLGRTGQPFWQDESFDHWVRGQAELRRIVRYIEGNPVKAGLADRPEEWPWSSARERHNPWAGLKACPTGFCNVG